MSATSTILVSADLNSLGHVTEVGDFGLDSPVPLILEKEGMIVEETSDLG